LAPSRSLFILVLYRISVRVSVIVLHLYCLVYDWYAEPRAYILQRVQQAFALLDFCYNLNMASQPQKMKNYNSFSEWKEDQSDRSQELIKELQALIEKVAPRLTTTVKWGQGCWTDGDSPRVFIHTEDD